MKKVCAKCGATGYIYTTWRLDMFPEFHGKPLCNSCFHSLRTEYFANKKERKYENPFEEADAQGKRSVIINDIVLSVDGIGKHLKIHVEAAEKYGYSLINMTQTETQFSYFMNMVFEKKELKKAELVNCPYCKTRYDATQFYKCPNCGGILTA